MKQHLIDIYAKLLEHFGPRGWWPARTRFEVCVGAVLTQNTAWRNVERAIGNLRSARALTPHSILALPDESLAQLIRPAGYFNIKTRRLKALVAFLDAEGGPTLRGFDSWPDMELREALLGVYGVGPETADSILLYALGRPFFVVDAYTRRIAARLGLTSPKADYDELQRFFCEHLPVDIALYNDFHAQLVILGNSYCHPRPLCPGCPLNALCPKIVL